MNWFFAKNCTNTPNKFNRRKQRKLIKNYLNTSHTITFIKLHSLLRIFNPRSVFADWLGLLEFSAVLAKMFLNNFFKLITYLNQHLGVQLKKKFIFAKMCTYTPNKVDRKKQRILKWKASS